MKREMEKIRRKRGIKNEENPETEERKRPGAPKLSWARLPKEMTVQSSEHIKNAAQRRRTADSTKEAAPAADFLLAFFSSKTNASI